MTTNKISLDELYAIFGNAVRREGKKEDQAVLNKRGVKNFKRTLLGLCGAPRFMEIDDFTDELVKYGAASREKAAPIINALSGHQLAYSRGRVLGFLIPPTDSGIEQMLVYSKRIYPSRH